MMLTKLTLFNFIFLFFISIKSIKCITEEDVKALDGEINAQTIEKDVEKIAQDYTDFDERYNDLLRREEKDKVNDDYDKEKYKAEYKKYFDECEIFYEYFFKQRKRLSNFINKPTGQVPSEIVRAHNYILQYVLESKNLVKELGEKIFIAKEDL